MKSFFNQTLKRLKQLHKDEKGMETIQAILILAIAALVAVAVYQFGQRAVDYLCDCFYGYAGEDE